MIPNRFHFVFGLRDEPEPFHLVFYLCLASCRRWHPTADILFHCHHVPFGRYWDLARDLGLTLVPVEPDPFVASFRYPDRTLDKYRYAHHSDVIRLDALIAHGGVYADIDTLFLTPIPDDLRRHPFVLGREDDVWCHRTRAMRPSVCNAFLAAEPHSAFARIWRERLFEAFDGSWSNHAGFLPYALSLGRPADVHVEPQRTFFRHGFPPAGVRRLLEELDEDFEGMVSMHLWSHLWWDKRRRDFSRVHAGLLTEDYIRTTDTTFTVAARPFLPVPARGARGAAPLPSATVSVIVPTHNRADVLGEAIDSVLAQTRQVQEILVVDDGSVEAHRHALAAIAARSPLVRVLTLETRGGRSKARNAGLTAATGEYVVFLDDDDVLGEELVASALRTFEHERVDIVVSLARRFGEVDRAGAPALNPFWTDSEVDATRAISAWMDVSAALRDELAMHAARVLARSLPPTNAFMVRRDAIGATRFAEDLDCGEDRLFWLELAANGCRFRLNPEGRVYVRERPNRSRSRTTGVPACRRAWSCVSPLGRREAFLALAFWARTCWLEGRRDWWRPAVRMTKYPDLVWTYGSSFAMRAAFRTWRRHIATAPPPQLPPSVARRRLPHQSAPAVSSAALAPAAVPRRDA